MRGFIRYLCGIWKNFFLLKMMGGMEKDVCTWYFILMEDG
jgi:hypothetical protein